MSKRKQGELEASVMNCLWDSPEGLSSQQILDLLGNDKLAITTVLTVLSRLGEKSLVTRKHDGGRRLLFQAILTREAHTASLLLGAMEKSANPAMVFSHFTSGLTPNQLAELKAALDK